MTNNCVQNICHANKSMDDVYHETKFDGILVKCIEVNFDLKFEQIITKLCMVVGFNEEIGIECIYRMHIITNNGCKCVLTPIKNDNYVEMMFDITKLVKPLGRTEMLINKQIQISQRQDIHDFPSI